MADSNRFAIGEGSLDLNILIINDEGKYCTPEPLVPCGDLHRAMNGPPNTTVLDHIVLQTASYFREKGEILLSEL